MPNQNRISISKDEWLVIGVIVFLSTVLISLLPTMMASIWFTNLVPPLQYLLYNLGFILLTIVLIGAPISHALKKKVNLLTMLRGGISSWLIFSFIMDMWQPPFAISQSGSILIADSESLVGTSVDFMLAWVYTNILNIPHAILKLPFIGDVSLLFLLVYFITPILSVVIAAVIFKPGFLIKLVGSKAL